MITNSTQKQIPDRSNIVKSHKLLWNILDANIINTLIHLFDTKDKNSSAKIVKYIEDERTKRGLNTSNSTVTSEVMYGNKVETSLYLNILKNGKKLIHLSFHLSPTSLKPKSTGVIHIYKNIYETNYKNTYKTNTMPNPLKRGLYAILYLQHPIDKPKSLEFSIATGHTTSNEKNAIVYDIELQQEMDVIITVLNRLFDEENTEYYIGNRDILLPIHNNTNTILNNMNVHKKVITRKNKGTRMYPPLNTTQIYTINKHLSKTLRTPQKKNQDNPLVRALADARRLISVTH